MLYILIIISNHLLDIQMKFLHIVPYYESDIKYIPTSDTFKEPKISRSGGFMHSFNIDGALYLSALLDNDLEQSNWYNFRKWLQMNCHPSVSDKKVQPDQWIESKTKCIFDIDFTKHNIYVIDTPEQLKYFFVNYGIIRQKIFYYNYLISSDELKNTSKSLNKRFKLYKDNIVLIEFLASLSPSDRAKLDNITKLNKFKTIRNIRNLPLIRVKKNKVLIPMHKISYNFLVDLIRTIENNDKIVGDPTDIFKWIKTKLIRINYQKMLKDGYNGIYYSTNLIRINSDPYDSYIQKIDIGDFPDILGNSSSDDLREIKEGIETYIQWLGSDTMILWKWIFD